LDVSSGLTFDDGEQLLVSAQKPLGLLLEERSRGEGGGCIVVQVTSGSVADRSGIRKGDVLIAVQNLNVEKMKLEDVMEKIASAPKVVNLRFWRGDI
jgi:C-terminal processing protease CtpA/Prc